MKKKVLKPTEFFTAIDDGLDEYLDEVFDDELAKIQREIDHQTLPEKFEKARGGVFDTGPERSPEEHHRPITHHHKTPNRALQHMRPQELNGTGAPKPTPASVALSKMLKDRRESYTFTTTAGREVTVGCEEILRRVTQKVREGKCSLQESGLIEKTINRGLDLPESLLRELF